MTILAKCRKYRKMFAWLLYKVVYNLGCKVTIKKAHLQIIQVLNYIFEDNISNFALSKGIWMYSVIA